MSSKAERTKQFIVEKTAPVFNKKGYAGTSINDLMEVTGLSKGSIYGNFENKDEVALAAFDYNFGRVVTYLKEQIKARKHTVDKLLVYPETYRRFLELPFLEHGCPVLNTSTEADDTHPLLRERAARALFFWKESVERHIRDGIAKKEIKAKTDAGAFAVILMSLIEGAVMQAKVTGSSEGLRVAMDYLESLIRQLKK